MTSKIESAQLSNNVILTGVLEQPFETHNKTKQQIYNIIAEAIRSSETFELNRSLEEAMSLDISYCTTVGKAKMGMNRPISMTFSSRDDTERIMSIKSKLPQGIYMNNEYPLHVKCARDTLCLILQPAKSLPLFQEKSKIEGDHLVINGINYGIQDISKLQPELAGFKAIQKEDENYIAFHRELSPYSNFHRSKFKIDTHTYHSSDQWIQYQKAILFGDSFTANQILTCSTPYEENQLGYQINGFEWNKLLLLTPYDMMNKLLL